MDIPTGPHFMFITFILIYYPATQHNTGTYFLFLFFLCKKPLRFFISFGIYLIQFLCCKHSQFNRFIAKPTSNAHPDPLNANTAAITPAILLSVLD